MAAQPGVSIYTCTDASGKKLTSDRPIAECSSREQRELNADGSIKRIVPPTATADERAAAEARDVEANAVRVARQDAIRRDRNLLMRFPSEAAHRKAREAALDDARKAVGASEARITALAKERKPLLDEAEFYAGRQMPIKLKNQIEANEVATEAQRALILNQQAEVVRISQLYDAELERLKKLWSGVQPGSLGVLQTPEAPASAALAAAASSDPTRK
ncbi:MAG: hypothetical protein JSR59_02090 [Proteobacteria bacterium]|nr:hypothetical protein [Pseudomonadota bacterium]